LAGEGYLNFMGNEFGHPEWIDFPREGNGWSYHYCRRQWSLVDNDELRYCELNDFDKAMLAFLKKEKIMQKTPVCNLIHQQDKVISYSKGNDVFIFNFHPQKSFEGYFIPVSKSGNYKVVLSTDNVNFGGHDRIDESYEYVTEQIEDGRIGIRIYIPSRCAVVLKKQKTVALH